MARLRRKGLGATELVRDNDGAKMPIMLKLAVASGAGLQLTGDAPRAAGLRLLGPGADTWPQSAADVDLGAVVLDGIQIAAGTYDAMLERVEIAACRTGLAIEGPVRAIVDCGLIFCR